jgi:coproporphyrinogen III oxidase-like Fe-S oxidoreductase
VCEELTIELNPDPLEDIADFLEIMKPYCARFKKIRLSFGIQSLSDSLLQTVGRRYTYQDFVSLIRLIRTFPEYVYNMDLIAFGVGEERL